jgi:hypothetical protein
MTPEGKVKKEVREFLRSKDVWYYQPVQNGMGQVGIPDFICCYRGMFVAIETKAPGKTSAVTPNQQRVIDAIKAHGGLAVVVDSLDSLTPVFDVLEDM